MQINQSKEKANIPRVKISLLVLYVPRNGSLIQNVWKTCFSNKSDSKTHGVMLGKKKGSTSVRLRATNCSATHWDMTLCSRLTQVLVIDTWQGHTYRLTGWWGVHVADLHAVCALHHCTISATRSQSQEPQKQHSPRPYLICCFSFGKNGCLAILLSRKI